MKSTIETDELGTELATVTREEGPDLLLGSFRSILQSPERFGVKASYGTPLSVFDRHVEAWTAAHGSPLRSESSLRDCFGAFRRSMERKGSSSSTLNVYLAGIKAAVRSLVRISGELSDVEKYRLETTLSADPFRPVTIERTVGSNRVMKPEEVATMVSAASPRMRAFVAFAYSTGARISEILSIKLSSIMTDRETGSASIRIVGKGRKERTLTVPSELIEYVRSVYAGKVYLFESSRRPEPLTRTDIGARFRRLAIRCFPGRSAGMSPHSLRHAFATEWIAKGLELTKLSKYLGHSAISTTVSFYVESSATPEELRGMYDGLETIVSNTTPPPPRRRGPSKKSSPAT